MIRSAGSRLLALPLALALLGAAPKVEVGKPAPDAEFTLVSGEKIALSQLRGQVVVINFWATWCVPCREETPLLMSLAERKDIVLVGINNKDEADSANRFLATLGNPFSAIGADINGRVSIDWGVTGVPETFIVDGKGMVRHRHWGPLAPEDLTGQFNAEIEKAKGP